MPISFGVPVDMDPIRNLIKGTNIKIIMILPKPYVQLIKISGLGFD